MQYSLKLLHLLKMLSQVPKDMLQFDLRIKARTFAKFFNKDGTTQQDSQCFKCGDTGHMSRECPQVGGGHSGLWSYLIEILLRDSS